MKTIDVCGLSCPEPVVRTLAALKTLAAGEALGVLADSATARDNVVRTAGKEGCEVTVTSEGAQFRLTLTKR